MPSKQLLATCGYFRLETPPRRIKRIRPARSSCWREPEITPHSHISLPPKAVNQIDLPDVAMRPSEDGRRSSAPLASSDF